LFFYFVLFYFNLIILFFFVKKNFVGIMLIKKLITDNYYRGIGRAFNKVKPNHFQSTNITNNFFYFICIQDGEANGHDLEDYEEAIDTGACGKISSSCNLYVLQYCIADSVFLINIFKSIFYYLLKC
jgi:hypothetical protein